MLINNNLKHCRENLEMTQEELGYVLGVTKGTVANWENGNDSIPLRQVVKICNQYDLSVDYLLGISRSNKEYFKIPKLNKVNIGNLYLLLNEGFSCYCRFPHLVLTIPKYNCFSIIHSTSIFNTPLSNNLF